MPVSYSKHSHKKGLYLAKNIEELNKMVELPANLTNKAYVLVKTAEKIFKDALYIHRMKDEERAYVLFMKFFNLVTFLKKTADYTKEKTYYDNLLGAKTLMFAINKAEELSGSLKERYDLKEAEIVAKALTVDLIPRVQAKQTLNRIDRINQLRLLGLHIRNRWDLICLYERICRIILTRRV